VELYIYSPIRLHGVVIISGEHRDNLLTYLRSIILKYIFAVTSENQLRHYYQLCKRNFIPCTDP
jgi:hypothetical protein